MYWKMAIRGALYGADINWYIIECGCSRIVLHRANKWIVSCPICGLRISLPHLREEYRKECETNMDRIKENQQETKEMLERIHKTHQKTIKDLPKNGEIPCGREIKPGIFLGCEAGEEPIYDNQYYACVICDWAKVCEEVG